MIALLLAVLLAYANGATDVRTGSWGGRVDDGRTVEIEYVAPDCPTWIEGPDGPCAVTIRPDWTIEIGR